MRKGIKVTFCLVGAIVIFMITYSACGSSPNDWPTTDEMIKNLHNKGYNVIEDNEIEIDKKKYTGRVVIATKGTNFVAGFWADDPSVAKIVYDYWGTEYQAEHSLRVGSTVYYGTKAAIKHAGINLK